MVCAPTGMFAGIRTDVDRSPVSLAVTVASRIGSDRIDTCTCSPGCRPLADTVTRPPAGTEPAERITVIGAGEVELGLGDSEAELGSLVELVELVELVAGVELVSDVELV